jgi:hypothetical protein
LILAFLSSSAKIPVEEILFSASAGVPIAAFKSVISFTKSLTVP